MRGKKGVPHRDPADPPRRRANSRRGHGTYESDRPPIVGLVGRQSGRVQLTTVQTASSRELLGAIRQASHPGSIIATDEWNGYQPIPRTGGRTHWQVDHSGPKHTWALDLDGDGVREVHCNTQEGLWTGLRNFLRPFRGVSKWRLPAYVAMFEWSHNLKCVTDAFLRALLLSTVFAP